MTQAPGNSPLARFKELCLDVREGPVAEMDRMARFWADVVGLRAEKQAGRPDDVADVVGEHEYQGIAVCPVPEARTVKNRIHLDVYTDRVESLVALGAQIELPAEESGFGWTVMRDPEGGEFCAFLKEPLPGFRLHGIVVDSADPERNAHWWADILGAQVHRHEGDEPFWAVTGFTPDPVLDLSFVPVPEPKTVKNRIHWDVYGEPAPLVERGARVLWEVPGRTGPIAWTVLGDPEGNEFCVFAE